MSTKSLPAKRNSVTPPIDPNFAPVARAFASDRQVTCGKLMASIGLKVNGRIFAMMVRGRFVAKLPRSRVDELVQTGVGHSFDPRRNGRPMKEWVVLKGTKPSWLELAKEAHRFVKSR
jgi:TfoX/Sxy family transcriptional regulator of competence genes